MSAEIEAVARAISGPCGRCNGRGMERHQLTRDPKDGSADWPCPVCKGGGRTVVYATPEYVAQLAIGAMAEFAASTGGSNERS